jgi:hypothetical protein
MDVKARTSSSLIKKMTTFSKRIEYHGVIMVIEEKTLVEGLFVWAETFELLKKLTSG